MSKRARRNTVTAELVESTALKLRRTTITPARARALAPGVERINDAALAAADETDFNDEPARFTSILAQLKSPSSRR
jgi:hypothetical protein